MVDEPMEMSGATLVESWNLVTDTSYVACLPWKVVCSLLHGSGDGWVLRSSWTNLQSLIPEAAQRRKQYANSRLEALEDIDMDLAETIFHTSNLLPTGHQNVGEWENWDKLVLALRGHTSNNPRLAKLMLLIQSCNPEGCVDLGNQYHCASSSPRNGDEKNLILCRRDKQAISELDFV